MKLVSKWKMALIFITVKCTLFAVSVQVTNQNSRSIIFTNHLAMLRAQEAAPCTNAFEIQTFIKDKSPELVSNVLHEITDNSFDQLMAENENGKDVMWFQKYVCREDEWFWVAFSTGSGCYDDAAYARFRKRVKFYVSGRFAGHSTNYLYQAISETKLTNDIGLIGLPIRLKYGEWIPSKWTNIVNQDGFWVVIDGPYPWVYDQSGFIQKRDAKQYDPRFKQQFESAEIEAKESLLKENIKQIDTDVFLAPRIKQILKRRFNIDWLTPEEIGYSE